MDKRRVIFGVIGAAAFVVGGIVARTKAIEITEIVEDFVRKEKPSPAAE